MASIWDDDDDDVMSDTKGNKVAEPIIPQDNLALVKHTKRQAVEKETKLLFESLTSCEAIVVTIHTVAAYVPAIMNEKIQELWENKIIPVLAKTLTQDVRARSIVIEAFNSIENLAICIRKGAEMVIATKGNTLISYFNIRSGLIIIIFLYQGSAASLTAARRIINEALTELKQCITVARDLETEDMKALTSNFTLLISVMGPQAEDSYNQASVIEEKLQQQYKKQKELVGEIANLKGQLEVYNNLIHVTEKRLRGSEAALEETKRRSKELAEFNKKIEESIQSIPTTYDVTETYRFNIFSSTDKYIIPNPNRNVQKEFYESTIKVRVARIEENNKEKDKEQAVLIELGKILAEYKGEYASIKYKISECEKNFVAKMKEIQSEIDKLKKELEQINRRADEIFQAIGLQGSNLRQLLTRIKSLSMIIGDGALAYQPIMGVLKKVKATVETSIEMLSSNVMADIFLAGKTLLDDVDWLAGYRTASLGHLETSSKYKALSSIPQYKAITNVSN
ncbi:unnamed protein product [Adineta steineri]|uniref:Uncharacterized protein n=1 Tax=Adineta steineri TaxID=433720 RepID=A0A815A6F3_9BILA|nr:unnamed protein product [Adineta steineri]